MAFTPCAVTELEKIKQGVKVRVMSIWLFWWHIGSTLLGHDGHTGTSKVL